MLLPGPHRRRSNSAARHPRTGLWSLAAPPFSLTSGILRLADSIDRAWGNDNPTSQRPNDAHSNSSIEPSSDVAALDEAGVGEPAPKADQWRGRLPWMFPEIRLLASPTAPPATLAATRHTAGNRNELAPVHCPVSPVLATKKLAHLGTAQECCGVGIQLGYVGSGSVRTGKGQDEHMFSLVPQLGTSVGVASGSLPCQSDCLRA